MYMETGDDYEEIKIGDIAHLRQQNLHIEACLSTDTNSVYNLEKLSQHLMMSTSLDSLTT